MEQEVKTEVQEQSEPGILGWRKLAALAVLYGLGWYIVVFGRLDSTGAIQDVPPNVMEIMKWGTMFFFGANTTIHSVRAVSDGFAKGMEALGKRKAQSGE